MPPKKVMQFHCCRAQSFLFVSFCCNAVIVCFLACVVWRCVEIFRDHFCHRILAIRFQMATQDDANKLLRGVAMAKVLVEDVVV